jgi:hypothetical protein
MLHVSFERSGQCFLYDFLFFAQVAPLKHILMKALKVDENGFKWMKMVKMDDFLATRMFFWFKFRQK